MYFVIDFFVCSIFLVSLYRKSFLVETSPNLFKLVGFCWSELSACAVVRLYCGGNIMLTFLNNHWWGRVLLESLYRKSFSNSVLLFFWHFFTFWLFSHHELLLFFEARPLIPGWLCHILMFQTHRFIFWLMFSSGRIDKKRKNNHSISKLSNNQSMRCNILRKRWGKVACLTYPSDVTSHITVVCGYAYRM